MRRYSPGSRTERKCVKDYQLPGTDLVIPKDSMVIFPIGGIHMDEKYYPDPEKFDPERFSQENKAKRDTFTYLPFGNGPRNCIGKHMRR
jgi:cytochrome P450 family 6